jgi:hypothetical protein
MVALEAVVACEVALEGREHRHPKLIGVIPHCGEIVFQRILLVLTVVDDEPVLNKRFDRFAFLGVERALAVLNPIQKHGNVGRDEELGVGEGVHQKHLVCLREHHLQVEHRRLHRRPFPKPEPDL